MFFEYDSYAYYLCVQPVDMRSGAHRLSQIVVAQMSQDPLSKKMFLFVGKNRKAVRCWYGTETVGGCCTRNCVRRNLRLA